MRWLRRWSGFLLFAAGAILAWALLRRSTKSSLSGISGELEARRAEAVAEKTQIKKGTQAALVAVESQHVEAIKTLTAAEHIEAVNLRADPVKLARFLVEAGRRNLIVWVLAACCLAAPAQAQVVCDPDVPGACAAPISKGAPSPITGQVLTTTLAVSLGQKAAHCDERIGIELDAASATHIVAMDAAKKIAAIDLRSLTTERNLYKAVAARELWEHPLFLVATVAVVAVGSAAATAAVLRD